MALSDIAIRNTRPTEKPFKLTDGAGLYLLQNPNGSRLWRWDYRFDRKRKTLSMGSYPDTSLAAARSKRDQARATLASGRDPSAERKEAKVTARLEVDTFRSVSTEWLARQKAVLSPVTYAKAQWMLGLANDQIGDESIRDLTSPQVLTCLRTIEAGGRHETAHRIKARISQVMRYAIATGRAENDPTYALRGALSPVVSTPRSAITDPIQLGSLLRAIDGYTGLLATRCALRLAPLLFVRPGELRFAEWSEVDLDNSLWRIPAAKTKMRSEHLVPLSTQVVEILRDLKLLTGHGKYLFPSTWDREKPMSENTVNTALRRLGFSAAVVCGHGFRATASTMLNEQGWSADVIERQLAHKEPNRVRAVYNRAQYMDERKLLMQHWADYCDALKCEKDNVVTLRRRSAT